MDDGTRKKYCPLIKKECLREQCEWWSDGGARPEYARCIVRDLDSIGFKLFKIQQALEGGARGGARRPDDFGDEDSF